MFVKHLVIWIFLLALVASCGGSKGDVVPGFDESPTAVRGALATIAPKIATSIPVMATATQRIEEPVAVSTATKAVPTAAVDESATGVPSLGFAGLYFALTADGAAQSEFPVGTEEVYAHWEYSGMLPADSIRRIWFRNDEIWLTRKEGWNWGEYGSDGAMRDMSVYDNEGSGLPPATYRLQLYVNDELQEEATFVVLAP